MNGLCVRKDKHTKPEFNLRYSFKNLKEQSRDESKR